MAVVLKGLKEVENNINKQIQRMGGATEKALEDVTEDLLNRSVRLAPVDKGDLRKSSYNKVEKTGTKIVGEVGFGTKYAVRQHEHIEYNHPKGGQAKYLEQPFKENAGRYIKHIAEENRKVNRG